MIDHIAKRTNNQGNQNRELQSVGSGELREEGTHCSTGLHLDQGMVMFTQTLLECSKKTGEVILIILGKVRSKTLENGNPT